VAVRVCPTRKEKGALQVDYRSTRGLFPGRRRISDKGDLSVADDHARRLRARLRRGVDVRALEEKDVAGGRRGWSEAQGDKQRQHWGILADRGTGKRKTENGKRRRRKLESLPRFPFPVFRFTFFVQATASGRRTEACRARSRRPSTGLRRTAAAPASLCACGPRAPAVRDRTPPPPH